jgi:hypothetical protein
MLQVLLGWEGGLSCAVCMHKVKVPYTPASSVHKALRAVGLWGETFVTVLGEKSSDAQQGSL